MGNSYRSGIRRPGVSAQGFYSKEEGFTLLELVIALVLIGIIAVIITGAMKISFDTVDKGEKRISSLDRFQTSFSLVDSQIQSQIPLTYDDNGEKKFYFDGSQKSIRFSSNYSLWNAGKGYVLVTYTVEMDSNGKEALTVSENIIGMENRKETKLFKDFDAIHFEYYYKGPSEAEGVWTDEWTDPLSLPLKVMLHLAREDSTVSFIIPMRTTSLRFQFADFAGSSPWLDIKNSGGQP